MIKINSLIFYSEEQYTYKIIAFILKISKLSESQCFVHNLS